MHTRIPLIVSLLLATTYTPDSNALTVHNISTGFDNATQALIPNGSVDDDYSVTGDADTYTALVLTEDDSRLPGTYIADNLMPDSRWLYLIDSSPNDWVPTGNYLFTAEFDLSGFHPATAQVLGLEVAADNAVVSIAINGTPVFSQVPAQSAEEFSEARVLGDVGMGLFQPGNNVITIEIRNTGPGFGNGSSSSAMRLSGVIDAAPVPEPACAAVLGLAALMPTRRREHHFTSR